MISPAREILFNGLPGPTHNFSGLSLGNIASTENKNTPSNPREAALEVLEMMMVLYKLGIPQAVLPPHERPHIPTLRTLGFTGNDASVLAECVKKTPEVLPHISSSASMWAANSAAFTPSMDSLDGKAHFSVSNMLTKFHRAIEAPFTFALLNKLFSNSQYFVVHPPLPSAKFFADEGSANHLHFIGKNGTGIHIFVYGYSGLGPNVLLPTHYPPRQTLEASQAIARRHNISENRVFFAQQHPHAIDAGIFHNDVISTGNGNFFLYHEDAFVDTGSVISHLQQMMAKNCDTELKLYKISSQQIFLSEAVSTYLFNSQIVTLPDGNMLIIATGQCRDNPKAVRLLNDLVQDPELPINNVLYIKLDESMRNGGGPGCLRLRLRLTDYELNACHQGIIFNDIRYTQLKDWINKYYREELTIKDLRDPDLLNESQNALNDLTQILKLGTIYSFQKA